MSNFRTFAIIGQNATKSETALSKFITTLAIDINKVVGKDSQGKDVIAKTRKYYLMGEDTERAEGEQVELNLDLFVPVKKTSYWVDAETNEQRSREKTWIELKV